jgi:hypothetical protein
MNLGRFSQFHQPLPPLTPDGDPITIYVDGIRVSRY